MRNSLATKTMDRTEGIKEGEREKRDSCQLKEEENSYKSVCSALTKCHGTVLISLDT